MLHPPRPINGPIKLESTVIWPSYLLDFLPFWEDFEEDLLLKDLEDILERIGIVLKDVEYEISLVNVIGLRHKRTHQIFFYSFIAILYKKSNFKLVLSQHNLSCNIYIVIYQIIIYIIIYIIVNIIIK